MKKLLLVVIVTGLMSMSAMAGWVRNTTIAEIHVTNASVRVVFANPSGGNFGPKTLYGTTADDAKNMMATALTAKSRKNFKKPCSIAITSTLPFVY